MEDFTNDLDDVVYYIEPPLEVDCYGLHKFLMHQQAQHQHMDVAPIWPWMLHNNGDFRKPRTKLP